MGKWIEGHEIECYKNYYFSLNLEFFKIYTKETVIF